MKKILVPVDFSGVTDSALKAAARLAGALQAELLLLHVAAPEPEFIGYETGPASVRQAVAHQLSAEHRQLQALQHELEALGLRVTALLIQGYTIEKILAEAERMPADLIVMGSHGHGGLHHLLMGSVAEGVVRKARCPVVLVPVER
jgi:nucleotide-binding universal stress UspA family protein